MNLNSTENGGEICILSKGIKEVCTEINQSLDLTFSPLIIKETFEDTSKTIESHIIINIVHIM
jgi:late competence protein required for DNA uptake (superfamily II DNA/RNA helicase)